MAIVENPNRFSIPVEAFLQQLLLERYPKLNVGRGSAIYDLLITPAALLLQPFRDRMRVIQRNQSMVNYAGMLPEELDRWAANFLVSRKIGSRATGVQRIFFTNAVNVVVPTTATFTTDSGLVFRPATSRSFSAQTLLINELPSTGEYYVDVYVTAEQVGSIYAVKAGDVTFVSGVSGAVRTTNINDFVQGTDPEGNAELYSRIKDSLVNKDLVKESSFRAVLLEAFPSITKFLVQGFGDPLMTRDVASITLSNQRLFEQSFCQKVNLPIDLNGTVTWPVPGQPSAGPAGGFVGAIYDLYDKDFYALPLPPSAPGFGAFAAQPGFLVRLLGATDEDAVNNDYTVVRVERVPVTPGGPLVSVLRVDRAFKDTALVNVSTELDKTPYTILGHFTSNKFHVGGKVDIYVETSSVVHKSVIISALQNTEAVTSDTFTGEVPLASLYEDDQGQNLFENSIGFDAPVIAITSVEQLDPADESVVVRELEPGVHYSIIRKEARGALFVNAETDVLQIRGYEELVDPETGTATGVFVPLFIGQRIRVNYTTNPDVALIQEFVDDSSNRDVTKSVLVRTPQTVFVDVQFSYRGVLTTDEVQDIVKQFILSKDFKASISINEILSVLSYFGISDITLPLTLSTRYDDGYGTAAIVRDQTEVALSGAQIFVPEEQLTITKLG